MKKAIKITVFVFLAQISLLVSAGNVFDQYNLTGEHHRFIQQDEDIFWEGGLIHDLETDTLDISYPRMPHFTKYKIRYTKWTPMTSNNQVVIYNHGLQSHSGWFNETAEKLSALGYTVYAFDRIGTGTSGDGKSLLTADQTDEGMTMLNRGAGHTGNWKVYTRTIHLMKQLAKAQNPGKSINIWANSYAANIVTAYILQYEPEDVSAYVFTSPGLFSILPLPFPIDDLINSQPGTYFPTTIPEQNGDQGAYLFTSIPEYQNAITRDRRSQRDFTKEFYFNILGIQNYHFGKAAQPGSYLDKTKRFYLVVNGDPMMSTQKTIDYVSQHASNATLKLYNGGADNRHFLTFTEDAQQVLNDVDVFLTGQTVAGAEVF
ncbi:alpha/beta hydrolase [Teredinibacter sp. KSP-S5-2]|uniref:alpha/beta hydrolase n=1 Tax=Teredinibacter sp. KSP-S5-2 TaxID=3034506 RepID=UPI002934779B|nr:alpha/beta fold hydrolase [Teredinibacter sp. KSP-S5-2]WNO11153.1 alpha/beta fold hydrolase [Teredinibacter sp. KSP-S5-2]